MSERTGWDRRLRVRADGKGLVGHAGAVLLRKCADRVGLTDAFAEVLLQSGQLRVGVPDSEEPPIRVVLPDRAVTVAPACTLLLPGIEPFPTWLRVAGVGVRGGAET